MASLQPGNVDHTRTKDKAVEDARNMQASIVGECRTASTESPPYVLSGLIGKGSFGRVYKATAPKLGRLVAVKIISIEEGDSLSPGGADTFSDILKEVGTLKLLNASGARNINAIIDTLLVGQSVWMVTEYCAGGSVATLMRPTGGLAEKWIIPILREVAEAIRWVHKQGIIHRDIKCANVLVTETGGIQLCDFGVAGIIESKFDKRSTVTGTLQWMAPELFDSSVSYGMEVDIWAFGSMAYEVASGLPPNATNIVDIANFGSYLKQNCPRLEGDQFSSSLKDLVACCMVQDSRQRPRIEQIQRHPYIFNTTADYPTASLSKLVNAYKLWEIQGGTRRSLFSAGGAQGQMNSHSAAYQNNEWSFDTISEHQIQLNTSDGITVYDAYGPPTELPPTSSSRLHPRRRPPNMKRLTAPLEKVFDPNTITSYEDNARVFYGKRAVPPGSDLPLRDDSEQLTVRESLIDLDASLDGNDVSHFVDLQTIRAGVTSAPSDLADVDRRQTCDWTFPMMAPASAAVDVPYIYTHGEEEPINEAFDLTDGVSEPTTLRAQANRASALSLIDLDDSLPTRPGELTRPSTTGSNAISTASGLGNTPFDLVRHSFSTQGQSPDDKELSAYASDRSGFVREPSLYALDESHVIREPSIYAPDDVGFLREPCIYVSDVGFLPEQNEPADPAGLAKRGSGPRSPDRDVESDTASRKGTFPFPSFPPPPSADVMLGTSSPDEVKDEFQRMILSLSEHLRLAIDTLSDLPLRRMERVSVGESCL